MKLFKFHGKFRECIPAGYTFSKLYARNYRCYWKNVKYGDHIWIWQQLGGYCEINDFYSHSGLIFEKILRGEWTEDYYALDKLNNVLVPFVREEHDTMTMHLRKTLGFGDDYDAHCERWRRVAFEDETIAEIRLMGERGWIKIGDSNVK